MNRIDVTPETTVAEHASALTELAHEAGVDPILFAAEQNLVLCHRIQEALETCSSGFINLDGFNDPDWTGYAVMREDIVDALTGDDRPFTTRIFHAAFVEQMDENRRLRDEFVLKLQGVTRVTVVGPGGGRELEEVGYPGAELHLQDHGQTLKIFPKLPVRA